jgi:excisionase family DNA binding protein
MARQETTTADPRTYVSLDEATQLLSVSTRTIRRRISDGSLRGYRLGPPGSRLRLRVDELVAWVEGEDAA